MNRRRALALLLAPFAAPQLRAQQSTAPESYAQDVEFLLTEFEKRAGHFFALKGIDWKSVGEQFRNEVKNVNSDAGHVVLCSRLVTRLRDGHATLGDIKLKSPAPLDPKRWSGPGLHLLAIDEKLYIRHTLDRAREAGLHPGMEIRKIDGAPAPQWLAQTTERLRDKRGFSTEQMVRYEACHDGLVDAEGTTISFDLLHHGEQKTVTLTRASGTNSVPIGPVFPPPCLQALGRQKFGRTAHGFAYIHLRDVPGDLPEQLDKMLPSLADAKGLILDTRANGGGGCDHEAVFARFIPAGKRWRQYRGAGAQPFTRSMVVIVDAGVRSAGETVAGMFKEDGRALMLGDTPTAGMSSQKTVITVPSGLFSVRFSVASNKGRFNQGRGIEGLGVPPHEITPYDPADLLRGVDTQIRRAEEFLLTGLPKERIPWENIQLG